MVQADSFYNNQEVMYEDIHSNEQRKGMKSRFPCYDLANCVAGLGNAGIVLKVDEAL